MGVERSLIEELPKEITIIQAACGEEPEEYFIAVAAVQVLREDVENSVSFRPLFFC